MKVIVIKTSKYVIIELISVTTVYIVTEYVMIKFMSGHVSLLLHFQVFLKVNYIVFSMIYGFD